jgi:hypothetical protein
MQGTLHGSKLLQHSDDEDKRLQSLSHFTKKPSIRDLLHIKYDKSNTSYLTKSLTPDCAYHMCVEESAL